MPFSWRWLGFGFVAAIVAISAPKAASIESVDPEPSVEAPRKVDPQCKGDQESRAEEIDENFKKRWPRITKSIGKALALNSWRDIFDKYRTWVVRRCSNGTFPQDLDDEIVRDESFRTLDLQWVDFTGKEFQRTFLNPKIYIEPDTGTEFLGNVTTLTDASLLAASIVESDFRQVEASGAVLAFAEIRGSDLRSANFANADLSNAAVVRSKVDDADFEKAMLHNVIWEANPGSLPSIPSIARAQGLSTLRFEKDSSSLFELRNAFDKAGFADQASDVNFSIRRSFRETRLEGGIGDRLLGAGSYLFFELTCAYGSKPWRPVILIFVSIPLFAMLFFVIVVFSTRGEIWVERPKDSTKDNLATRRIKLGTFQSTNRRSAITGVASTVLWFSFLNSFRVGYRDINVGDWLARVHRKDFVLQSSGFAKSVAGIQSLAGFYLLVLAIISTIGKPFW